LLGLLYNYEGGHLSYFFGGKLLLTFFIQRLQKFFLFLSRFFTFFNVFILGERFFYSARNARIASAVLATAIPSVRLSVRHTPVLCQNDGT